MQVEIISTGDEVITGFITDTNVAWLCQELLSLGIQPHLRHTVGDNLEDIVSLLKERSEHCDVLLVNGGMGPTSDDNTTEAAALAAGVPQVLNQTWLTRLEAWHKERNRPMPPTNVKQAMLPQGAVMLDNPRGTACGFMLKINRATCFFTPGVPSEFKPMYLNEIRPRLVRDFLDGVHTRVKRLFLFGISESLLGQKIEALQLPASIVVGYRAAYPLLELKLIENDLKDGEEATALERIQPVIAPYLICEDTFDLPSLIRNALGEERLALFDNVTAGSLAYQLASANLSCAYLSSEGLKGSVRDTLLAGSERYFLALLQDVDGKSFHLELKDTKEKRVWNRIYNLEVTLKDRKKAAIALIAADFLLSALTGKSALTPDNCEITVLSAGENYVA